MQAQTIHFPGCTVWRSAQGSGKCLIGSRSSESLFGVGTTGQMPKAAQALYEYNHLNVEKKFPAAENSREEHFLPRVFYVAPLHCSVNVATINTCGKGKVWQHSCGSRGACLILNTLRAFGGIRCQRGSPDGTWLSLVERQKFPSRQCRIQWKYPKTKLFARPSFG